MSPRRVMLAVAGAAACCAALLAVMTVQAPAAFAFASAGVWGKAIEVPGLGALNAGGYALVSSVSCGSAGNCAAGGLYTDGSGHDHAFVVSELNGRWGRAVQVPGLGALDTGGNSQVNSVSCASAGNCAAGGFYADGSGHGQAFVAVERNGRWGAAIEVPGSGALNTDGVALVSSVSCGSAGNCAAGGSYASAGFRIEAFVAVEVNGRWGTAIEVPGSGALNTGGGAQVSSVSCGSAGNCAAGGSYAGRFGTQAFVVDERNGRWGTAIEVPGSRTLNKGGLAQVNAVSCASAGNCAAGGSYSAGPQNTEAFVAVERNGRWGSAIEVPGSSALNTGGAALVSSVSCGSAGSCAVGGRYQAGLGRIEAFVAVERNGRWGTAIEVPGSRALNRGGQAAVTSVSCPAAGTCAVGGYFRGGSLRFEAFVAAEQNGRWGTAIEVPGLRALNVGENAQVRSVSCGAAGSCAAAGTYRDGSHDFQGFVVNQT